MRVAPDEYLSLPLRAHEMLRGVQLHDVSIVDLPGGGAGRRVADIRAIELSAGPSRIVGALFGVRYFIGRVFGWDRERMSPEASLVSGLTEQDRRTPRSYPVQLRARFDRSFNLRMRR